MEASGWSSPVLAITPGSPEATGMDLEEVAEDGFGYVLSRPGAVREVWPNVILTHSPIPMPENGWASRIRFAGEVDGPVRAVRAWFGARGCERFIWVLGPSATPTDLEQRLLDLGAEPKPTLSEATAMVLDHEPPGSPAGVEIRRVGTFEDYAALWEIIFEAFEVPEHEREAVRAALAARWSETEGDDTQWVYLALVDEVPVAIGGVRRTAAGPLWLAGGATLPRWRGRGLYRALVSARWKDAVRLGAPGLVVHASDMSRPILERLGFRAVCAIKYLADRSAPPMIRTPEAAGGHGL
jgi:predicted N-acetyltransferase YhbS